MSLLKEKGHPVECEHFSEDNVSMEYHCANSRYLEIESNFAIHEECDGKFANSETLCFYLMNTGEGGELGIYHNENEDSLHEKIQTKSDKDGYCKCIIFDEYTFHRPLQFSNGVRKMVSFHINKS